MMVSKFSPTKSIPEGKGKVRKEAAAQGTVKKSRGVKIIEHKNVGGDDPIEYFAHKGLNYLWSPRG